MATAMNKKRAAILPAEAKEKLGQKLTAQENDGDIYLVTGESPNQAWWVDFSGFPYNERPGRRMILR